MKKYFFLIAIFHTFYSSAQDSSSVENQPPGKINHEISINTTLLFKQIFNLSNTSFPTLPYDLTYKLIYKKSAFRAGVGISVNNSSVTVSGNSGPGAGGPDEQVPTINKSTTFVYRLGWERRYMVGKKVLVYWGLDFTGVYGKGNLQSSSGFNNLPISYSYTKTTENDQSVSYGGGPVSGIQFFITKRLSIYTEIPVYFEYLHRESKTVNYRNSYDSFNGWISTTDTQTQKATNTNLNVTLPVTLYLAIKF